MKRDILHIIAAGFAAQRSTGVVPCIIGIPGNAKSASIEALATVMGVKCKVLASSQLAPEDLNGMPVLTVSRTESKMVPFAWGKTMGADDIIFLDEFNQGSLQVQAAMMRLTLTGCLGPIKIGSYRVACMNPPEWGTAARPLGPPTANRLMHVPWQADVASYELYLRTGNGFDWSTIPIVSVSEQEMRDEGLHSILPFIKSETSWLESPPPNPEDRSGPWASQRTWTVLGGVVCALKKMNQLHLIPQAAGYIVGIPAASAWYAFYKSRSLPQPEDVLADVSVLYTLADAAGITALKNALKYAGGGGGYDINIITLLGDLVDDDRLVLLQPALTTIKNGDFSHMVKKQSRAYSKLAATKLGMW